MKIIKVGNFEVKTKDKVCGKCKSELQYEPKDVKSDRDGRYIICPVCGQFIAVQ